MKEKELLSSVCQVIIVVVVVDDDDVCLFVDTILAVPWFVLQNEASKSCLRRVREKPTKSA